MPRTTWTLEFRTVFCLYILCDIPCPFNRLISGLGAHVLSFADPDGVDPIPNEYPRKKNPDPDPNLKKTGSGFEP